MSPTTPHSSARPWMPVLHGILTSATFTVLTRLLSHFGF
jgi:hypothetical protein